ncbi:hypothetical protein TNCV_333201 [Trichonephila clavipes]|nr:hypothetical protein TNCV_333201 [Trichonephila clavipes]
MLLDVSMCLVVLFSDFGITKKVSVSRRPVPGRPRATTPAETVYNYFGTKEKNHYCIAAFRYFQASVRRISATTVRKSSFNAGLYALPGVRSPQRNSENRLCWAREHVFLDAANFLCCSQTSPIYNGE